MLEITIPGFYSFRLEVLILDYNGTIALDGQLLESVRQKLIMLSDFLEIHIVTSDTFGSVTAQCQELPIQVQVLKTRNHTQEKADYLDRFANRKIVAIGNGSNDQLMLKKADLGIVVLGTEGCSGHCLMAADVLVKDIHDALDLLRYPERLIATLRR